MCLQIKLEKRACQACFSSYNTNTAGCCVLIVLQFCSDYEHFNLRKTHRAISLYGWRCKTSPAIKTYSHVCLCLCASVRENC